MAPGKLVDTTVTVLRRTPYADSSLVAACVSPDMGRVDFILRGARRVGRRASPEVDLFREFHVQYRERPGDGLRTPLSMELAAARDGVARRLGLLAEASELALFTLASVKPAVSLPRYYHAMGTAFERLAGLDASAPWADLARLVYLDEAGLLPAEHARARSVRALMAAIEEDGPPPALSAADAARWRAWIEAACAFHGLQARRPAPAPI